MEDVKWLDERLAKMFKETPTGGVEGATEGVGKLKV